MNTPPIANNDTASTNEDTPVSGNVLTNDTDANGGVLSVTAINGSSTNIGTPVTLASGAQVTLNANGSYIYNPNGQFETLNDAQSATDSFQYSLSDGQGGSSTATATVTINGVTDAPVNRAPVADDDAYNTAFNTPLTVTAANGVLNGDTDANADSLTARSPPNPPMAQQR
ncbi:MAG: cadherin-like domain-containing protein [Synechococcales cyanobacterium CRU_2_2]|nr:cadherin-like domain-containing protein [Synechococcales cyanobacterium CRU_2_2]